MLQAELMTLFDIQSLICLHQNSESFVSNSARFQQTHQYLLHRKLLKLHSPSKSCCHP